VEQVKASGGSPIIEEGEDIADPVEEMPGEPPEEIPPQTAETESKSGKRKNRGTEK
jgi:hypothetical protein